MSQGYRELVVWQKAMELVTQIYGLTEAFPKNEGFGLTSQVRRAVVSVPSNIAEGKGRDSTREFIHYLYISYGSLMETETQIQIAANLSYITQADADRCIVKSNEVGRLLNGLIRSLKSSVADGRRLTTDN
jgi:four helix bundle protein